METEVSNSNPLPLDVRREEKEEKERVRVKRKTLETVLEQCQRALELLSNGFDEDDEDEDGAKPGDDGSRDESSVQRADPDADQVRIHFFLPFFGLC